MINTINIKNKISATTATAMDMAKPTVPISNGKPNIAIKPIIAAITTVQNTIAKITRNIILHPLRNLQIAY